MTNLSFAAEPWSNVAHEIRALTAMNGEETGLKSDIVALDVDWALYRELDAAGALAVTTARDGIRLVGYYVNKLAYHAHYRKTLCAFLDAFFLHPDYRSGAAGMALFQAMEQQVRALGVKFVVSISKKVNPVDAIFRRLGWVEAGTTYQKVLK